MCEKYEEFFKDCLKFKKKVETLRKKGQNEYNPFLVLTSEHIEDSHSTILFSFLDINSNHYQGDLFLKYFLEVAGLGKWFGNTKKVKIKREKSLSNGRIDLYINNGEKCIIIENKIWAGDRDKQIQKYIEEIGKNYNLICVIYLSLYGNEPSKYSLGEWEIDKSDECNPKLKKQDAQGTHLIEYRQLSYKNDILDWLNNVQKELKDITNLNQALEAYKDMVKIITHQKEEMDIADFLKDKGDEEYQMALEIIKKRDKIITSYLEKICKELQKEDFKDWEYNLSPKYENKELKFIFYPKNKREYFFAFAWCNCNGKGSFEARLCGENTPIYSKRAKISEQIRKIPFDDKERNIIGSKDEQDKPPFEYDWNCVKERISNFANDFNKEEIKNFIKKYKSIVSKINEYL
ncbi:MAG: PD-(D/E)XK nuclease family protein [Helicobacter sp.]|nr:PD-(D/E)XK nuclease family protein [Helicobacter sp.]